MTNQRQEQVKTLLGHLNKHVKEYLYDSGLLEKWKTVDPSKVDEFWKLNDWLDHACTLYLEDKIPWDRDFETITEVIQPDSESTPVSVAVKRYDFRPSVMQAARDLLIFIVLP